MGHLRTIGIFSLYRLIVKAPFNYHSSSVRSIAFGGYFYPWGVHLSMITSVLKMTHLYYWVFQTLFECTIFPVNARPYHWRFAPAREAVSPNTRLNFQNHKGYTHEFLMNFPNFLKKLVRNPRVYPFGFIKVSAVLRETATPTEVDFQRYGQAFSGTFGCSIMLLKTQW